MPDFPAVPLRLTLTGDTDGVSLVINGETSADRRISATEVVLLPIERRLQVEAVPADAATFAAHTRIGLDIVTESRQTESRQGGVPAVDAGALQRVGFASLEYAGSGWTLTTQADVATASSAEPDWVGPGRFALRRARSEGATIRPAAAAAWGLVVDSSASMRATFTGTSLADLVEVTAGILAEWTAQPPGSLALTGLTEPNVLDPTTAPRDLAAASRSTPPASWSIATPAIAEVARRLGSTGVIALVTDGVPGDVASLSDWLRSHTGIEVLLVTTGAMSGPPGVRLAAVDADAPLDEPRAAALAAALLGSDAP